MGRHIRKPAFCACPLLHTSTAHIDCPQFGHLDNAHSRPKLASGRMRFRVLCAGCELVKTMGMAAHKIVLALHCIMGSNYSTWKGIWEGRCSLHFAISVIQQDCLYMIKVILEQNRVDCYFYKSDEQCFSERETLC